jgi:hypothetical protein
MNRNKLLSLVIVFTIFCLFSACGDNNKPDTAVGNSDNTVDSSDNIENNEKLTYRYTCKAHAGTFKIELDQEDTLDLKFGDDSTIVFQRKSGRSDSESIFDAWIPYEVIGSKGSKMPWKEFVISFQGDHIEQKQTQYRFIESGKIEISMLVKADDDSEFRPCLASADASYVSMKDISPHKAIYQVVSEGAEHTFTVDQ